MRKLSEAISMAEQAKEGLERIEKLFSYDTLDEADPGQERIRSDVTLEFGGPSTHYKTMILTRLEHNEIRAAIESILHKRLDEANAEIDKECERRLSKK